MRILFSLLLSGVFIVFFTVFGTFMGAASGWIVGWFFADTILTFFSYIFGAAHGFQMWEIGAVMGFLSGFFRPRFNGIKSGMNSWTDWWKKRKATAEADAIIAQAVLTNPRQPVPPKPTLIRG